jgi:hypothetical protein
VSRFIWHAMTWRAIYTRSYCVVAVYAFGHRTSAVWAMDASYHDVWGDRYKYGGRGLHSSTYTLNVSAFYWIGCAFGGCLGSV